jgi:hypothetical protein
LQEKRIEANEKPHPHRDTQASRDRKKPDSDTIESCFQFTKNSEKFPTIEGVVKNTIFK